MFNKNGKKVFMTFALLFTVFAIWYSYKTIQDLQMNAKTVANTELENSATVSYDTVQLKSQKDFKIVGKQIFLGTGFEPGFNLLISLAGNKFGTELVSQYGDTHYVGYLDLVNKSTSTKIFAGKMLDKNDKVVDGIFTIFNMKCFNPKGDEVPLSVTIKVATETLSGCAVMLN